MIEKTGDDLVVIASHPDELAECQLATIETVKRKQDDAQAELTQARTVVEAAESAGIAADAAKAIVSRAQSRVLYLSKVRAALEAGCVIVPNFPGDTIAIRVKREKPRHNYTEQQSWKPTLPAQKCEILPVGEGRYVDTMPFEQRDARKEVKDGKEITVHAAWSSAFDDEISMPVAFLKPTVLQRTGMCMARKIFDEVAVAPGNWTSGKYMESGAKADPMVLGRIHDRRNRRTMTFLIAWFLDSRDI